MAQIYLLGLLMVLGSILLEVSPLPSNNEPSQTTSISIESLEESTKINNAKDKEERSVIYNPIDSEFPDEATKEILEKIQAINEALKKPHKQQHIKWPNSQPETGGSYSLDKDTLEKLQQVISSGKLHSYHEALRQQESNSISNDNINLMRQNRQMQQLLAMNQGMQTMPIPYIMNMPVLVMPSSNNMYNGLATNNINSDSSYQTRQSPAPPSPFQFQWPFAQIFPVLIKDPFLSLMSGAGWNNLIEYGQNADVCSRKHKNTDDQYLDNYITENKQYIKNNLKSLLDPINNYRSRQKRSVKKRTISNSATQQDLGKTQKVKTLFSSKPSRKPVRHTTEVPQPAQKPHSAKIEDADEASDLRFPFSDFTLFGNRKPVAPSPGFFINRLKVRRGGVAIAGPGGVATAGKGGTAIVGPGGLAYTQPGGVAVAGPAARVVALSADSDLSSIVSRLQKQSAIDDSTEDQNGEASYEDMELEGKGQHTTGRRMNINSTD